MSYLRTIDTLKGLKGKLNFLPFQNQALLEILKLSNTLTPKAEKSQSSLDKYSVEDIMVLSTPTTTVTERDYNKMLFQVHVHQHSGQVNPIGTIYEELNVHQKRLVLSLLNFSDKLNVRQMAYLQYAIRLKLNTLYPNWKNIHFNRDSQYLKQFYLLPNLASLRHLNDIKTIPKKKVTTAIIASRKKQEQAAKN